jgi:hypothetical protein
MEVEVTTLDTASIAEWLCEFLMDLPVVEKPIPSISMNCDNQIVVVKVNSSKDNTKSSRHVKRRLKSVRKMRNSRVIALDYVPTAKNRQINLQRGCHEMWLTVHRLRPTWWTILVVTYPMWIEIRWIIMVKQTNFQSKIKDPCWFILDVLLFYNVWQDGLP